MVEIRHLTAGYDKRPVLRDVSLTLPDGCVTAIIGPNGCGKSTLLRAIVGQIPAMEGEILVEGRASAGYTTTELARRVAYLPQNRRVPEMTVGRLVLHGRFPHLSYPRRYRQEDYAAAEAAMEQVGIAGLRSELLPKLSGGTRQKAYIATALAQGTPAILLDEPTTFLDIGHQLQVMALCRELAASGKAVAAVLHDLSLAMEYADRIVLMDGGRVAAAGTAREVMSTGKIERVFGVRLCAADTPEGIRYFWEKG